MVEVVAWLGAAVVACLAGLYLAVRHSNRSWSDEEYENLRKGSTAGANALLSAQALLEPGARHIAEQRRTELAEDVDSAGPPVPGGK
jgi:hypothetical protein